MSFPKQIFSHCDYFISDTVFSDEMEERKWVLFFLILQQNVLYLKRISHCFISVALAFNCSMDLETVEGLDTVQDNVPCNYYSTYTCPYNYCIIIIINLLVGMLLVSRSGLVEEDAVEVFHFDGFHLSSSFLMYNFKSFQGK